MSNAISTTERPENEKAEHAIETARALTRQAGEIAKRTAERVPAGVVVVVGGAVLLAADAFGIGEVITAGIAGYAAYRLLRKRAVSRADGSSAEAKRADAERADANRTAPSGAEATP
jgi:hypothetical protein